MDNFVDHMSFGGGSTATVLHPLVLAAVLAALCAMLILPRRYSASALLVGLLLIPRGQQLLVGGVHLYVSRLLIMGGWIACSSRRRSVDPGASRFTLVDQLFLAWAITEASASVLLFQQMGAVVNQIGFLWDGIGGYFLLRRLILSEDDITATIKSLAVVSLICGLAMAREHFTGTDAFAFLGGVRQALEVRNGTPRAEGPFAHALLAGTYGATLPPLLLWLWKRGSATVAVLGLVGSTLMASTTMCSSPILTYVLGIGAICLWSCRRRMRVFRWGLVGTCVVLQICMKAPFWFVLGHIDLTGGSNGWYRAALVDTFITHFSQWWMLGTIANRDWADGAMWDACNQFVSEGVSGGLCSLVLFISLICVCFRWIGIARRSVEGDSGREWFFWLLGVTLFSHIVAFFGIDYFDQMKFAWYALLAMVVCAAAPGRLFVPAIPTPLAADAHWWCQAPDVSEVMISARYAGEVDDV